ncbi:MAG: precorrin-6y C5,15-methyltransferase (decarboxylating) subunit CbiE, partial [Spirochaetaceae bacterium]|nr:precorrin-6y C5,15-methyltransferase (decarboxylating) subunit CbiE [Spirochaetaceae bacterium]
MSEMLHSLLVFEPAARRQVSGQAEAGESGSIDVSDPTSGRKEDIPSVPVVVAGVESGCMSAAEMQPTLRRLLDKAELICAGRDLLESLVPKISPDAPLRESVSPGDESLEKGETGVRREFLPLAAPWEAVWRNIAGARAAGLRVLVLADGDPLFFGIGASLARRMGPDAVHVIPAVSSLQLACARLGLPWHNVLCFSLHGRSNFAPLNAAVGRGAPLCLLTDDVIRPNDVAGYLLDR